MCTNGQVISYQLTRTSRKNINITIKNDGFIYVSAPRNVALSEINKIVSSKTDWILKTQKNMKSKKIIKSNYSIRTNTLFYYYGKALKLKVLPSVSNSLIIEENELIFYVKKEYIEDAQYKYTEFIKLLRKDLKKVTTKMVEKYLNKMELELNTLEIRTMSARWGTCIPAKKKILLNFHLVHCPPEAIEYVVLHEVSHLLHPNHSKRFYDTIALYMPNYKERKAILQDYIIQ